MHILLSNDDGFQAPGIAALYRGLPDDWRITIVAPYSEQSAQSHALTIRDQLCLRKHPSPKKNVTMYSLSGTPADCTKFALEYLLKDDTPDLVLSGINNGYNLGSDAIYSGTVSAAMESLFLGIPSLAVSIRHLKDTLEKDCVPFITDFIKHFFIEGKFQGLVNLNFPEQGPYTWEKLRVVEQGLQKYHNAIEVISESEEESFYEIRGSLIFDHDSDSTDVNLTNQGFITITALSWQQMDHQGIRQLKDLAESFVIMD